jgi:Ca-activated chloride channel family protein
MSDDKLKQLLDEAAVPEPNALARARIKREAMAAFISETNQGKDAAARLTETTTVVNRNERSLFMKKRIWISSIAASLVMVIIVVVMKQMPKPNLGSTIPEVAVQPPLAEQPVLTQPAQEQTAVKPATPAKAVEQQALAKTDTKLQREKKQLAADAVAEADSAAVSSEAFSASVSGGLATNAAPASMTVNKIKVESLAASRVNEAEAFMSPPQTESRDRFSHKDESPVKQVKEQPVSTFSIDVDTASYSFVRRQLNRGVLPAEDAVRVEEMINYFDYHYPLPASKKEAFATQVHVLESPWHKGNLLVHIGIKGYEISREKQPDSNLVFLLDVSGSMDSPDKLPLVKQSMSLLLDALKPTDSVAIVVYAGAAGCVLEPTQVKNKHKILAALEQLQAGGSTAGGQGLALAYQLAERNFKKDAVNRIMLATDGDFNVGITQDERLEDFVARKRKSGIYLSVFGFGEGNYQDALMQTLAQNGNGVAAYIDTLGEAQKIMVNEATRALFPIANDVKIQVEFNPATVAEYRLIGYETRALNREDFNNDKVDAGDIGAGHTVTAIYEITPLASSAKLVDDSRYSSSAPVKAASDELGFIKLRYKRPGETQSSLLSTPIVATKVTRELTSTEKQLIDEVNFSVSVAGFAQILRGGKYTGEWNYDDVIALAQKTKGDDAYGYRTEFIQLVRKAKIASGM